MRETKMYGRHTSVFDNAGQTFSDLKPCKFKFPSAKVTCEATDPHVVCGTWRY